METEVKRLMKKSGFAPSTQTQKIDMTYLAKALFHNAFPQKSEASN